MRVLDLGGRVQALESRTRPQMLCLLFGPSGVSPDLRRHDLHLASSRPTFPQPQCTIALLQTQQPHKHLHNMFRIAHAGPSRLLAPTCARALSTTAPLASGHSRWSKIRHRKGAADAAKSKAWGGFMTVGLRLRVVQVVADSRRSTSRCAKGRIRSRTATSQRRCWRPRGRACRRTTLRGRLRG